jgi:hypothetical protein
MLSVVSQLRLGHVRARRHQRPGERAELVDDCLVVIADERA